MAVGLLDIPQELRIQVLSHLDAISLTRCAFTCKSLYETFCTTSQLQYVIQLHLEGLTDTGISTDYAELIQHLQRRRTAWLSPNTIEKGESFTLKMKHACIAYELVGGAFADANMHNFEIAWLPTSSNDEGRILRRASTEMRIRDFAMDPTQDVIAFLEDDTGPPTAPRTVRIHIRTISTDTIHPLAQQSPLQVSIHHAWATTFDNAFLQFARNTLVFYFCTPAQIEPHIQIWDWTTSEVIADSTLDFDPSISPRTSDFGLLDSTYCFITSMATSTGSIRLYKLVRSPLTTCAVVHVATLYLPTTASGAKVTRISAHAGPIEANPLPHVPFMQNDDDRLHVFTLQYRYIEANGFRRALLNMFVHQRVFAEYCTQYSGGQPLQIPWEEWGPMNTRLVYPAMIQQHWLRYVHGQRVLWPSATRDWDDPDPDEIAPSTVEVFDFSLAAVLSAQEIAPTSPSCEKRKSGTLSMSSTICAAQLGLFQDDVETHLPYVSTVWNMKQAYSAYMIHEGGIVGANASDADDGSLILDVYPV